jgi:hypothetical protein
MWIANLSVLLIIAGCAAYQYLKGTVVKAFATIIITICASVVAFGYFELLARLLAGYAPSVAPWAQLLSFVLLLVVVFAILQTAVSQLIRQPIDLGTWPERVGRIGCGAVLGVIVSGLVLTALQIGPLPAKYPYERFSPARQKVLLNADGLATGLFSLLSKGSFGGKRSFAALHPDFLDQIFLNRLFIGANIPIVTDSDAIEVPAKAAAWPAPDAIRNQVEDLLGQLDSLKIPAQGTTTKPVLLPGWQKGDYDLTVVRVGIKREAVKPNTPLDGGLFALPQLRLICKERRAGQNPLLGTGINIYPIGHLKSASELQTSLLIQLAPNDFEERARTKYIDFVFCVPRGFVPVLVEFKLNSIAEVPTPVPADQAPQVIPFVASEVKIDSAKPDMSSGRERDQPSRQPKSSSGRGRLGDLE